MCQKGKTIKQLADEIGVSKQAIHQKRKKEPLSTRLQPFTSTVDGVVYISVDGEKVIKQAFDVTTVNETVNNSVNKFEESFTPQFTLVDDVLEILREQLEIKDTQIRYQQNQILEKEKQITELTLSIENLTKSLNSSQALHAGTMNQTFLSDTKQECLEENKNINDIDISTHKKQSFWSKLLRK